MIVMSSSNVKIAKSELVRFPDLGLMIHGLIPNFLNTVIAEM
jgi:hypothetical protein